MKHVLFCIPSKICKHSLSINLIASVYELFDNPSYCCVNVINFLCCLTGIALLYLHLYEIASDKGDHSLLHKSLEYIKGSIDNCKRRKLTFLCGDSGPLALAVVIYSLLGENKKSKKYRDMYVMTLIATS